MSKITVSISSSRPIFIEADADSFGEVFARMNSEEQVSVLRSMAIHMRPHRTQWDYIAIELEKEENREIMAELRSVLFPEGGASEGSLLAASPAKGGWVCPIDYPGCARFCGNYGCGG